MADKATKKETLQEKLMARGLQSDDDSIIAALKWIQEHPKPHSTPSASGIHKPANETMKTDSDSEERHQEGEAVTDGEKQTDEKKAVPRNMADKTTGKETLRDRLIAGGLDPDDNLSIVAAMKWIQAHPESYPLSHQKKPHPTPSGHSGIHKPAADKTMKNDSDTADKRHQEGDAVLDGKKQMWNLAKLVSRTKSVHTTTTTKVEHKRRVILSDRLKARGLQSVDELPVVQALELFKALRESYPLAPQKKPHPAPSDGSVIQELAKDAMKNDSDTAEKRQEEGDAITDGQNMKQMWENMKMISGNMPIQAPTSTKEERRARLREMMMASNLESGEELSIVTAFKRIHAHPELYPRAHQKKSRPSDTDIHEGANLAITINYDNESEKGHWAAVTDGEKHKEDEDAVDKQERGLYEHVGLVQIQGLDWEGRPPCSRADDGTDDIVTEEKEISHLV